jgi:phytoene dehydrogenase-like protein
MNYLADTYLPGLNDHVVLSELSTPVDFEKRLRSPEGAIYALRQDLPHSMMFRPSAKSRHIKTALPGWRINTSGRWCAYCHSFRNDCS